MADRKELEQALKDGCTVDVGGRSLRDARELPPDPSPEQPITGVVVRDNQGRLTREGMELAVKRGGSVLHQGDIVDELHRLPTPADLAKGDEQRSAQVGAAIDAQIAQLMAEKQKLAQAQPARQSAPPSPQSGEAQHVHTPPVQQAQPKEEDARRAARQDDDDRDGGKARRK